MAARAIWKGVLLIGGERVPVKLYSAVEDRGVHFRLLHEKDLVPVKQQMVNPEMGEAIEELADDHFDREELTDRYAQRLLELVDRKLEADEDVVEAPGISDEPEAEPEVIDLMAVLRRSLEPAGAAERAPAPTREGGDGSGSI